MKHKRTPGKWKWKLTVLDNGDQRVIFVDDNGESMMKLTKKLTLSIIELRNLFYPKNRGRAFTCAFYHQAMKSSNSPLFLEKRKEIRL